MVCLTLEDGLNFTREFNSENTSNSTPDWYMQVEDEPQAFDITEEEYQYILSTDNKRMWLRTLTNNAKVKMEFIKGWKDDFYNKYSDDERLDNEDFKSLAIGFFISRGCTLEEAYEMYEYCIQEGVS